MRILWVHDGSAQARLHAMWLGRAGHDVVGFTSPQDIRKAMDDRFDVVITDLDLEQIDSIGLARSIRHQGDALPICFIAAGTVAPTVRSDVHKLGILVPKDSRSTQLLAVLDRLAPRSRPRLAKGSVPTPPELADTVKIKTRAAVVQPGKKAKRRAGRLRAATSFSSMREAANCPSIEIGLQGVLFQTTRPRPIGTTVDLTIEIAGQATTITGTIIWMDMSGSKLVTIRMLVLDVNQAWRELCVELARHRDTFKSDQFMSSF